MAKFGEILSYYLTERNRSRSFFAYVVQQLRVHPDPDGKITPTLAVSVMGRRLCLFVNTNWVESESVANVMDSVDHEAVHIIANHIPRWLDLLAGIDLSKTSIANLNDLKSIAVDMADNEFLKSGNPRIRSPEWVVARQHPFEDYPENKSFEEYLELLFKHAVRREVKSNTKHPWDLESVLGGAGEGIVSPDVILEISEHTKMVVTEAKEKYTRSHGHLPAGIAELVEALLAPPKIDWREVMKNLAHGSLLSNKRRSLRRPYRRHMFGNLSGYPGRATDRTHKIVLCIDTSGSVGADELGQALGILRDMLHLAPGLTVVVVECDAVVQRVYTLTDESEIKWSSQGRGGTRFDPAIEEANKHKPDITFYYTDGGAYTPSERTKCPFVWLLSPRGVDPCPDWGHHLWME